MSDIARLDLVVPLETLQQAILSDVLCQSDCEKVDRPLSEGGTLYRDANGQISSGWTGVNDAVSVWTRNSRSASYYPETVLAAVKRALRQAAASLVSKSAMENMIREAAQACIAAYFNLSPRDLKLISRRPPVSVPRGHLHRARRNTSHSETEPPSSEPSETPTSAGIAP